MNIIEIILCLLFVGGIFLAGLGILFFIVIRPILNYPINKENKKIQWTCEKTINSLDCHKYNLYYRTLPSELNKYVRIYGENNWIHVEEFNDKTFYNKEEFIEFIKPYETRKDIENFINGQENWIYP